MITEVAVKNAKIIWDYMQLHQKPVKSDAVFCLCSHDTRVAIRAADLMKQSYGEVLIISGGSGKLTEDLFTESEAQVFEKIALEHGVNKDKIILETESTNTGENIRFTYNLLHKTGFQVSSFVLVQKPYMEHDTYATFKKQWPDPKTNITVTSPLLSFDEYTSKDISAEQVINIMVGDLQRIEEYPKLGFQIKQEIPENVWYAYEQLIEAGFNKHLIR